MGGLAELLERTPTLPSPGITGRVGKWRGGVGEAYPLAGSFVCRCLTSAAVLRFHIPAHRTGQAGFPHPALGEGFTRSPTED